MYICTCTDNPINQTILSTFMKKKRIKFDVAKNGEEAVTKWQTGGFHLVLVSTSCTSLVLRSRLLTLFSRWTFRCLSWTVSRLLSRSDEWRSSTPQGHFRPHPNPKVSGHRRKPPSVSRGRRRCQLRRTGRRSSSSPSRHPRCRAIESPRSPQGAMTSSQSPYLSIG